MKAFNSENIKNILIIGPLPPPIGGSPLTVQAMVDELARYPYIQVTVINSSPLRDIRKKMTGFNFEKVRRILFILTQYFRNVRTCSVVLVFANNLFTLILVPILLQFARIFHKPFYIKPVGGGLDLYLEALNRVFRGYLLWVLRSADGILAQTQLLQSALIKMGCHDTFYLPGCRPLLPLALSRNGDSDELRLIFLAHITPEKGPLILLEALQIVAQQCSTRVSCDFYGPIHNDIKAEFLHQLEVTHNAHYCGVAEAGIGSKLISKYGALVLPSYFSKEGHPGVIIEAMHAGVPVISTQTRAIPELITNGENGLLIPARDSRALADAIQQIALDHPLRERLGRANYRKGYEFRTDVVIAQMLKLLFER